MDILTILLFCIILVLCAVFGIDTVIALSAGLLIFLLYGLYKKHPVNALLKASLSGIRKLGNIVIIMLIIGILTAMWRASGCIPTIVCYASGLIHPSIVLLMTFLLNAVVSYLAGTSFGTAATMGVICANIAFSLNVSPIWVGGAVMSGIFFGDRCSPVSSTCHLICSITETDIYTNLRNMVRSAAVPFVLSCLLYLTAGFFLTGKGAVLDVDGLFREGFTIHPICLLPAICVLALTILFHLDVKPVMLISILLSAGIAYFLQSIPPIELLAIAIHGYHTSYTDLAPLIDGGGLVSMIHVCIVVFIASCYSGLFELTGLLDFLRDFAGRLAKKQGNFRSMLMLGIVTCLIACNQSLAILLTNQLSSSLKITREELALNLSDTCVIIAALVPWSIASTVPLATIGAPKSALFCACYLYLIPLWRFLGIHRIRSAK